MNFIQSFYFIEQHPKCMWKRIETFPYGLNIEVVMVNPKTMSIDDDERKNTKLQVWLEYGENEDGNVTHDIRLDCGADTFEKAIIKLAKLVKKYYGNYKEQP